MSYPYCIQYRRHISRQQHLLSVKHFPLYKKTAVSRRNVDGKETAGKEGDKNFRPMDFRKTMPVKIGKRGEKRGSGRESPEGET